jgi:two-component system cell cycle sensor histidine kinase/response regulator CckA
MPQTGNETILVVDDEIIILHLTKLMLERYGYIVLEAQSGAEALRFFEVSPEQHVDAAILDIVMPRMDGFELAERLRALRPVLPILYTSGYSERPELRPEKARDVPYLAKPFTSVTLMRKLREILGMPKLDHAAAQD